MLQDSQDVNYYKPVDKYAPFQDPPKSNPAAVATPAKDPPESNPAGVAPAKDPLKYNPAGVATPDKDPLKYNPAGDATPDKDPPKSNPTGAVTPDKDPPESNPFVGDTPAKVQQNPQLPANKPDEPEFKGRKGTTQGSYNLQSDKNVKEGDFYDHVTEQKVEDPAKAISWRTDSTHVTYLDCEAQYTASINPETNTLLSTKDTQRIEFKYEQMKYKEAHGEKRTPEQLEQMFKAWKGGYDGENDSAFLDVKYFMEEGDFGEFYDIKYRGTGFNRRESNKALREAAIGSWVIRFCSIKEPENSVDKAFVISHKTAGGTKHEYFVRRKGWGYQSLSSVMPVHNRPISNIAFQLDDNLRYVCLTNILQALCLHKDKLISAPLAASPRVH